ncbi:MAG: hypothetical protein AAFX00_03535 [Pseudomonadota bacterium]
MLAKVVVFAILIALPTAIMAQPMSVIGWLSESVTRATPPSLPEGGAGVPAVEVRPLGAQTSDAAGLLSPSVTGFPRTLWSGGSFDDIVARIQAHPSESLPAVQDLFTTLLLSEAVAPRDTQSGDFLLARVDKLLDLGLLEPAVSLLEQGPLDDPRFFQRWFDASLLLGTESEACLRLKSTPGLTPTYPTRIFCLARVGDWGAANISFQAAIALDQLTPLETGLLQRFLDDASIDNDLPPLPSPGRVTPLTYRLFEAVGEPLPSDRLPRAFAHRDLGPNNGWRAQITAAERLAGVRAIAPERVFETYMLREPAASGGVWDRVAAIQELEAALRSGVPDQVANTLPAAWSAMEAARLEVPFARVYGERLTRLSLPGASGALAQRIALLSEGSEEVAAGIDVADPDLGFLAALGRGEVQTARPSTQTESAIRNAHLSGPLPLALERLIEEGDVGIAVLEALLLFEAGQAGDLDDVTSALRAFNRLGLETIFRRASLELLMLERRG